LDLDDGKIYLPAGPYSVLLGILAVSFTNLLIPGNERFRRSFVNGMALKFPGHLMTDGLCIKDFSGMQKAALLQVIKFHINSPIGSNGIILK